MSNDFYNPFYLQGGFKYDQARERRFLRKVLIPLVGWKSGESIVEIGAGMGHHSELLRQDGFKVIAIEYSEAGADKARAIYPDLEVIHASASEWEPKEKGHVFARGMSWYHYELDGMNSRGVDVPKETARIFDRYIAPNHSFVLQIVTDLTGRRSDLKVHMNRVSDYLDLFEPLGSTQTYDWAGTRLIRTSQRAHKGVIVVAVKG